MMCKRSRVRAPQASRLVAGSEHGKIGKYKSALPGSVASASGGYPVARAIGRVIRRAEPGIYHRIVESPPMGVRF
jgi:hypothetical protein